MNGFDKMVRAAVKSQARLTFGDHHEYIAEPDGTASTRRVMELELIESS